MERKAVLTISLFLVISSVNLYCFSRSEPSRESPPVSYVSEEEGRSEERLSMVADQIKARDITDSAVIRAMERVHRHRFIPAEFHHLAYADRPVLIGEGQTISQPYIVALMTQLLDLDGSERILEIGTGSGYQGAVLAETAGEVFSIEIKPLLHQRAQKTLADLGYYSIHLRSGDGYFGWEEYAPFDGIIITAAADHIPPPLLEQLAPNGVLVMPLGDPMGYQQLIRITKQDDDYYLEQITGVMFVPMTGTALDSGNAKP